MLTPGQIHRLKLERLAALARRGTADPEFLAMLRTLDDSHTALEHKWSAMALHIAKEADFRCAPPPTPLHRCLLVPPAALHRVRRRKSSLSVLALRWLLSCHPQAPFQFSQLLSLKDVGCVEDCATRLQHAPWAGSALYCC